VKRCLLGDEEEEEEDDDDDDEKVIKVNVACLD
jgi:hypothetical protein